MVIEQSPGTPKHNENHIRVPCHDLLHRDRNVPTGITADLKVSGNILHADHFEVGVAESMGTTHTQGLAVTLFEV